MSGPLTCVIVGAGHRSLCYANYAKENPDKMKIVGVADPIEFRRKQTAEIHGLSDEQCYYDLDEMLKKGKVADAAINGTMDELHVRTTIPLLEQGYDVLLEKPFAVNEQEMMELAEAVKKYDRKVLICHVLRYAPFYRTIREKILEGAVGTIMNIQTIEHVSYHHMAAAFVRGKWKSQKECGSSFIMAKCCHDLDLLMWMNSGIGPSSVSSFGSQMYFNEQNAPEGSGTRCLVDCEIEKECIFSARKLYVNTDQWKFYSWADLEHMDEIPTETRIKHLQTKSDYGKCVWKSGCDLVDHQSVMIEFENGSTATHNLVGGVARPAREIFILGTHGEIQGVFDDSRFVIRKADPDNPENPDFKEEVFDLNVTGGFHGDQGGHGGGDLRLVADFVDFVQGNQPSISCTTINDSIYGHMTGFKAEESRLQHKVVDLPKL